MGGRTALTPQHVDCYRVGMEQPCFHLSIPAINLELSRHWYEQVLGCRAGRSSDEALILDLGGH